MTTIGVSEFRANLMKVLKEVENGTDINITSRGKIVARLVPPDFTKENARKKLIKIGKKSNIGDAISPMDTKWEALS